MNFGFLFFQTVNIELFVRSPIQYTFTLDYAICEENFHHFIFLSVFSDAAVRYFITSSADTLSFLHLTIVPVYLN
jgi:hypothetical protein